MDDHVDVYSTWTAGFILLVSMLKFSHVRGVGLEVGKEGKRSINGEKGLDWRFATLVAIEMARPPFLEPATTGRAKTR